MPMKILIVDDNPDNLYMLESLLKGGGYEVAAATDGVEAIDKLKKTSFDMIISDILMPRMDGYGLCKACKQDEALGKIPFLLYTAVYTNREDEEFANRLGAARYIVKPVEPVELLSIIEEVLKESSEGKTATPRKLTDEEELYLTEYSRRLVNELEKKVKELENEIAARRLAEDALRKSEEKFRNLVETTSDFVWEVDRDGVYTYASPRLFDILGYMPGEVLGKAPFDFMPPEEALRVAAAFADIAASMKPFTALENANLHRDGRQIVLESSGVPILDNNGNLAGYRGIDRDITGRKKIENENKQLIHDLKERIKELDALHRTSTLLQNERMPPADLLKKMANFLPYAWQYPDITGVRVVYSDMEYKTPNYTESEWRQQVEFKTSDGVAGEINIVYLEQMPPEAEGPFMAEEKELLNSLAEMLRAYFERRLAETALKESEAYIRRLIEQSPIALIVDVGVDADEKIVLMNRKFTELFGYTIEDVPDVRHWWPLAYPDEKYREEIRVEWVRRTEKAIQTCGEIEPMEAVVACKNGSTRYVRIGLASIGYKNLVAFEDLTERKQHEEALKDSMERFRSITSAAMDAIVLIDHEGRVIFWNDRAVAMFGYAREEAEGKDLHVLISPERYHADYRKGYEEFKKTGLGATIGKVQELEALRKDGTEFPVELSVAAVMLKGKWNSIGIIRDITDRRRAEESLKSHYQFLQTLIDTIPSPIFYKDTAGIYLGCNLAFEKFLGQPKAEIVGKTVHDLMRKDLADRYSEWDAALFKKPGVQVFESMTMDAEGKALEIISNRATFNMADGTVGGIVGIVIDITGRTAAERKMKEEMEVTSHLLMIARATSMTTDIDRLMESAVSYVHSIFGCDACLSYLWDGEAMEFVPSHAEGLTHGLASLFRGEPIGENAWFIKDALALKKSFAPLRTGHKPQTTDALEPLKCLEGLSRMCVMPLISRAGRAGLLLLAYRHEKKFTERDYRIMDGISHQISTALEDARLYTDSVNKTLELSHNIEAIQVMHELDRSILSTLDRDEMLDTAVGLVDRVVPCDYVVAVLVDKEKDALEAVAGNIADLPKGSVFPLADTLASEVIDTGRPQIIPDMTKIKKPLPLEAQLMEKGCRSSISVPLTIKGEVSAILFIGSNRKSVFTPEDLSMIEKLASQICVALENSRLLTDLNDLFIGIVKSLSEAIDAKSPWTRGHSERVTKLARQIAKEMGMDGKEIKTLEIAGLLHDIGKLGTYENILEKPGKLTDEELKLMHQHPAKGADILAPIKQLKDVIPAIKYHHEFYDGTGYPDGLKGEAIPFMARILTVADSVDAMGADRPYRKGRPMDEIAKELKRCSGVQFDPAVVEAFLKTL